MWVGVEELGAAVCALENAGQGDGRAGSRSVELERASELGTPASAMMLLTDLAVDELRDVEGMCEDGYVEGPAGLVEDLFQVLLGDWDEQRARTTPSYTDCSAG